MRNQSVLFFSLCLLIFSACVKTDNDNNNKVPIISNKVEKKETINKSSVNKNKVKDDIVKNNEFVADIGKEIDVLLKDF